MQRSRRSRSSFFLSAFVAVSLAPFGADAQAPRPGQPPSAPAQRGPAAPPAAPPQAQQPAPPKPYGLVPVTLAPPSTDASFEAFRKQLGDVAMRKDRAALGNLVVAKNFFWIGEKGDKANKRKPGIDNLVAAMSLDAKDGAGWDALAEASREATMEPFADRKGVMCSPASPTFDERAAAQVAKQTGTEPDDWGYPARAGVEVRAAARPDAPVVETLGMNLVRVMPEEPAAATPLQNADFIRVVTPSGKVGFVREEELSSLDSDQICYVKEAAGWKITGYVSEE